MANYKCIDCGTIFDDTKDCCPNCGCPLSDCKNPNSDNVQTESSKNYSNHIDYNILNHGRSTRAESIICELADKVLKFGEVAATIVTVILALRTLVSGIMLMDTSPGYGFLILIIGALACVITYYVIKYLAKIIWAVLRLFVNISTTLKRIEIFLESNKTNISE